MKSSRLALGFILLSAITLSSCLKKDYAGPPDKSGYDPMLPVNATIQKVLNLLPANYPSTSVAPVKIDSDWTISAVVVGDDKSGNLYKQIVIDDGSTGLAVLIDAYDLFNDYPVGRKIYIKLKGLYIGTYHSLPQLGYTPDNTGAISGIPGTLAENYLVKANYPNTVTPIKVTFAEIAGGANVALENRLIQIDSVEFVAGDVFQPYAAPAPSSGTSLDLEDCSSTVVLRTSGYSNFQSALTPSGRGSITAIYTVYNSTAQLVLRDTSDVKFTGPRCDGAVFIDPSKVVFNEDFQTVNTNNEILSTPGWTNYAETGGVLFKGGLLGSATKFAKISAFSTGSATVKSWLITPAINLDGATNPMLSFKSDDGYDNGATLKVYISSNYSGSGDPSTSTWTELTGFTISSGHTSGYGSQFISSGFKSLNGYNGSIYVAFVYEGSDPAKTTTFELDDVMVSKD